MLSQGLALILMLSQILAIIPALSQGLSLGSRSTLLEREELIAE